VKARAGTFLAMDAVPLATDVLVEALASRTSIAPVRRQLKEAHEHRAALHLAVMRQPYLQLLLDGQKTIESRFSVNRISPFEDVSAGDVLALKQCSGPVVGLGVVEHTAFYELDSPTWRLLRARFARPLCAEDDEFWATRERARYATLMTVVHAHWIDPIRVEKRDRRGWVRLDRSFSQQQLAL
jgi:hypothetical protein